MTEEKLSVQTPDKDAVKSFSQILENFVRLHSNSRAAFKRASAYLPGGVARSSTSFSPFPIFLRSGSGSHVQDLDGNDLVDYHNNFTSLIHGHSDPDIMAAVRDQLSLGSAFGSPTELEFKLAELIHGRMKTVEQMRFAGSGTEATQYCILAARAHTRRSKIIKFQGAFHGLHENVMVSSHPSYAGIDTPPAPRGEADSIAVDERILDSTYALPYNDLDSVGRLLQEEGASVAAVIVEPVLGVGGQIPGTKEFLRGLRELCSRYGAVLIFDEIVTGFRLSPGGAQEKYGVEADLTALGKLIGGGFPVGALGGSKEIMNVFEPLGGAPKVPCSGTFSANPVTLAAGYVSISKLTEETYPAIDSRAERIERELEKISDSYPFPIHMTRAGSLFNLHFVHGEVRRHYDLRNENMKLKAALYMSMAERGINTAARGMCCISTPMSDKDVAHFSRALEESLDDLRNCASELTPPPVIQ